MSSTICIIFLLSARLVLICGLPGSGKTTLSKQLATEMSAIRLCPDDWLRSLQVDLFDERQRDLLELQLWQHTQDLLIHGVSVILESGFWTRAERDEKRSWTRAHDIAVELHYLDVSIDTLLERVQSRHDNDKGDEVQITRQQLEEWSKSFQKPDESELRLFDLPVHSV